MVSAKLASEEANNQERLDIAIKRKRRLEAESYARICPLTQQQLKSEKSVQHDDVANSKRRLRREKDDWFRTWSCLLPT
jgi:hypothetical protein